MPLSSTELSDLAGLNAGRNPEWGTEQTATIRLVETIYPNNAPSSITDGLDVSGATLALVSVDLHDIPGRGSVVFSLGPDEWEEDWSETFQIVVNGQTYGTTGNSTEAQVYTALAADINTTVDPPHEAVINYAEDGETPVSLTVYRTSNAGPVGGASMTSNISLIRTEGSTAAFRIWGLPTNSSRWRCLHTEPYEITENWLELFRVSPLRRIYVQVTSSDGELRWNVAPCRAEET